jgi:ABC-type multidrug transport system ATPase subunit
LDAVLPCPANSFSCKQHDNLVPTMTAIESVSFYASIVLPPSMPKEARKARIARVLRMMGLSHAQTTLVSVWDAAWSSAFDSCTCE